MDCGTPIHTSDPRDLYVICLACMVERRKDEVFIQQILKATKTRRDYDSNG